MSNKVRFVGDFIGFLRVRYLYLYDSIDVYANELGYVSVLAKITKENFVFMMMMALIFLNIYECHNFLGLLEGHMYANTHTYIIHPICI
jgi:hypothetical protein